MQAAKKQQSADRDIFRSTVTIPEDVRDLFQWILEFDPSFNGSPASLMADLIREGLLAKYKAGRATAEPLDQPLANELAEKSIAVFRKEMEK